MKWLLSDPALNFKFSERTYYIFWKEQKCVVRKEALVVTLLTKLTLQPLSVNKWFFIPPPPPAPRTTFGLGTLLVNVSEITVQCDFTIILNVLSESSIILPSFQ